MTASNRDDARGLVQPRQVIRGRAPDRFISTGCRQDAGATKNRNRPACPTSSSGASVYLFYRTSKGDQRSKRDPPQRRPERKLRASLSARGGSLGTTHLRFSGVRWILHSRNPGAIRGTPPEFPRSRDPGSNCGTETGASRMIVLPRASNRRHWPLSANPVFRAESDS